MRGLRARSLFFLIALIALPACHGGEGGGPRSVPPTSPAVVASGGIGQYFVSVDGSDDAAGSEQSPFATIRRGLRAAHPGDTVVVRAGSYGPARFARGGTENEPITLEAIGDVTLTGSGSGYGLVVKGMDHIVIEGFDISNFQAGIALGEASHILIRDNTLHSNTLTGVQDWKSSDVDIVQNRFLDPAVSTPGVAYQDYGVAVFYASRVLVDRNYFFGRHNQALSFKRRVLDSRADGNTFEGCMLTCLYLGQEDDNADVPGDMTSQNLEASNNRFKPVTDPTNGVEYRLRTPIAIRNVTGALVENNVIDPSCIERIETFSYPDPLGLHPGGNTVSNNVIGSW